MDQPSHNNNSQANPNLKRDRFPVLAKPIETPTSVLDLLIEEILYVEGLLKNLFIRR